ncbi:MAG TPA: hypothetical protein VEF76_14820 [Patescibacteria group bacterium]|nr:hypothetical protein [Patescibacteria group bacterium]
MRNQDFCVIDAGPLITLTTGGALPELTAAGDYFQFKVLDIVAIEAGRRDRPGGGAIADWLEKMQAEGKLDIIETEVGRTTRENRKTDPTFRIKNAGEQAIADWIVGGGLDAANSAVVVYEDKDTRRLLEAMQPNADVVAVSTRAFLIAGEGIGFVSDATALWDKIHANAPTRTEVNSRFTVSTRTPAP